MCHASVACNGPSHEWIGQERANDGERARAKDKRNEIGRQHVKKIIHSECMPFNIGVRGFSHEKQAGIETGG